MPPLHSANVNDETQCFIAFISMESINRRMLAGSRYTHCKCNHNDKITMMMRIHFFSPAQRFTTLFNLI